MRTLEAITRGLPTRILQNLEALGSLLELAEMLRTVQETLLDYNEIADEQILEINKMSKLLLYLSDAFVASHIAKEKKATQKEQNKEAS